MGRRVSTLETQTPESFSISDAAAFVCIQGSMSFPTPRVSSWGFSDLNLMIRLNDAKPIHIFHLQDKSKAPAGVITSRK